MKGMNMAAWKDVLGERSGQRALGTTILAVGVVLIAYAKFLVVVDQRPGVVLADPLLAAFPAQDLTWPIFIILYGSVVVAVTSLLRDPTLFILALRSYATLVAIRMVCMWVVPLDPPLGMIALVDPVVQSVTGASTALSRDLFFSGHTSLLTLMACIMPRPALRILFAICAVMMGCFVLLQHVHYTIDVLVAPMAAYVAVQLMRGLAGQRVQQ